VARLLVVSLGAALIGAGLVSFGRTILAVRAVFSRGPSAFDGALDWFWPGVIALVAGTVLVVAGRRLPKPKSSRPLEARAVGSLAAQLIAAALVGVAASLFGPRQPWNYVLGVAGALAVVVGMRAGGRTQ
jgi:hypothetical protein